MARPNVDSSSRKAFPYYELSVGDESVDQIWDMRDCVERDFRCNMMRIMVSMAHQSKSAGGVLFER